MKFTSHSCRIYSIYKDENSQAAVDPEPGGRIRRKITTFSKCQCKLNKHTFSIVELSLIVHYHSFYTSTHKTALHIWKLVTWNLYFIVENADQTYSNKINPRKKNCLVTYSIILSADVLLKGLMCHLWLYMSAGRWSGQ